MEPAAWDLTGGKCFIRPKLIQDLTMEFFSATTQQSRRHDIIKASPARIIFHLFPFLQNRLIVKQLLCESN